MKKLSIYTQDSFILDYSDVGEKVQEKGGQRGLNKWNQGIIIAIF